MTDLAPFPDVELGLISLLGDLAETATLTPADLDARLPFLKVSCIGGNDNLITDLSRVDVDTFAATKAEAATLAEAVRQRLVNGKPHLITGHVLDQVKTDVKPHLVPYTDTPPPYRYTASYSVTARR